MKQSPTKLFGMGKFTTQKKKSRLTMLYKINWGLIEVPEDNLTNSERRTKGKHTFMQIATIKDF